MATSRTPDRAHYNGVWRTTFGSMRGAALAVMLMTGATSSAWAQWAPETSCDRFGGAELQDCLAKAMPKADAALNAAWRKAQGAIDSSDASASDKAAWHANLLAAQRAWLAFRDANCKFELVAAEWSNGSGSTPAQQACVLSLTQKRAVELTKRYTSN